MACASCVVERPLLHDVVPLIGAVLLESIAALLQDTLPVERRGEREDDIGAHYLNRLRGVALLEEGAGLQPRLHALRLPHILEGDLPLLLGVALHAARACAQRALENSGVATAGTHRARRVPPRAGFSWGEGQSAPFAVIIMSGWC